VIEDFLAQLPEDNKHRHTSCDYEYYIQFLEHERRNNRWVTEPYIRIDEEKVNAERLRIEASKEQTHEDEKQRHLF
jgi:hypothetical protein